jgi:hypothetical protein
MATAPQELNLPDWLREAFESGEPTDVLPNKRAESRRHWPGSCFARPEDASGDEQSLVHGLNLSSKGIGFLSREPFDEGQLLVLFPEGGSGEPVRIRVIHCTQTVGRYKIGGVFEQAPPPKKSR